MLVSRRVVYNFRLICPENLLHAVCVAHRGNQHNQIEFRIIHFQLVLNIICGIFINIHDNQLARLMAGNLTAQFTADGTSPAGDHNTFT